MTTKDSPPEAILAQAVRIAHEMKRMAPRSNGLPHLKIGICMDDKTMAVTIDWDKLEKLTEAELVQVICALMLEDPAVLKKETLH